jgi:hypothetical protein
MTNNLGDKYSNNLTAFETWNPTKTSFENYLSQNKVSANVTSYAKEAFLKVSNAAHSRFDKMKSPNPSDFAGLSNDIKQEMSLVEKEAVQDGNLSTTDKKALVTVTTLLSNFSDELINTCLSYYQNIDNGNVTLRCWFCNLSWQKVVNAIITVVAVVVITLIVAAIVFYTAGAGAAILGGATTFVGFLAASGVIGGFIGGFTALIAGCSGICAFEEPIDDRCFCPL